ncbi:MAG: NADH-quinone oxidoreductase subunit L [Actinobacteria bacterium]|nr:NADH-quinone oxidoreductase subunit L [Actinomycetota bacterium]
MNETSQMLVFLIAIPLFSAALLLLGGRALDKVGHFVGTLASGAAFAVGVIEFLAMLRRAPESRAVTQPLFTWIEVGNFNVGATLLLDQLSVCFVLLITGVGTLIHIYSIAYMSHDRDRRRFFAFLNLFIAAMLLLVLGDSYLSLYVGWEGVGLASYLLIGFWNQKPAYATAAKKAFVANRVGDVGLSLAVMIAFVQFGSVSFSGVAEGVEAGKASSLALNALGIALLLAAVGKSAQFPLQSWLGDAMAGPTPVSALIHAATMVTAGVYLIARSHFVFDVASIAQLLVVIVGAITLLFGAIIGMAKDDIKKALAASTMSQIGYMILATGLGPVGYAFAMMHLLTHGFFKAGMFLGAGSVMHGMNDEVDMRKYGGLRKYMPITFATFGLGYLAIIGVPPFAGFYSKDKIIEIALDAGGAKGIILGSITLLGAAITAFYMSRVMLMTFFGAKRWEAGAHPHESPALMTIPMILLAIGSVSAGFIFNMGDRFINFLAPLFHAGDSGHSGHGEKEHLLPPIVVSALALTAVAIGVSIAIAKYGRGKAIPAVAPSDVSLWTKVARRDLLQDEFNETLFMRPGQELTKALAVIDEKVIDGAVRGVGSITLDVASGVRKTQTGFVRSYALWIIVGAVGILGAIAVMSL